MFVQRFNNLRVGQSGAAAVDPTYQASEAWMRKRKVARTDAGRHHEPLQFARRHPTGFAPLRLPQRISQWEVGDAAMSCSNYRWTMSGVAEITYLFSFVNGKVTRNQQSCCFKLSCDTSVENLQVVRSIVERACTQISEETVNVIRWRSIM